MNPLKPMESPVTGRGPGPCRDLGRSRLRCAVKSPWDGLPCRHGTVLLPRYLSRRPGWHESFLLVLSPGTFCQSFCFHLLSYPFHLQPPSTGNGPASFLPASVSSRNHGHPRPFSPLRGTVGEARLPVIVVLTGERNWPRTMGPMGHHFWINWNSLKLIEEWDRMGSLYWILLIERCSEGSSSLPTQT